MMNIQVKFFLIYCLITFQLCSPVFLPYRQVDVVDRSSEQSQQLDPNAIAKIVCQQTRDGDRQISRITTIYKLADYFQKLPEDHELNGCKKLINEPLMRLKELIQTSNSNVCSDQKISMIEDYHLDFITTNVNDIEHTNKIRQKQQPEKPIRERREIPKILRLFFMHYAMEVSATCQKNLINNLEWDVPQLFANIGLNSNSQEPGEFNSLFSDSANKFIKIYSVEKFDDAVLIWDVLEGSFEEDLNSFRGGLIDEIDPELGEPIKLMVKVRSNVNLKRMQKRCKNLYKPIYGQLILPLIRLSDFGYLNRGKQFDVELKELNDNVVAKRWYGLTQLCEILLPIKIYNCPSMLADHVEIISREEALELEKLSVDQEASQQADLSSSNDVKINYEATTNSMDSIDQLESVLTKEYQKLVNQIKLNRSVRGRAWRRAFARIVRNIFKQASSNVLEKIGFSWPVIKIKSKLNPFVNKPQEQSSVDSDKKSSVREKNDQTTVKQEDGAEINGDNGTASVTFVSKSLEKTHLGGSLKDLSDEQLMNLPGGGFGSRQRRRRKVERNKCRVRKGDVDLQQEIYQNAISYKRTQSWGEMFAKMEKTIAERSPSRMKMILWGAFIIFLLVVVFMILMGLGIFAATATG